MASILDKIKEKIPLDKLKNFKLSFGKKKSATTETASASNEKGEQTQVDASRLDKTDPGVSIPSDQGGSDQTIPDQKLEEIKPAKKSLLAKTIKIGKYEVKLVVVLAVVVVGYLALDEFTKEEEVVIPDAPPPTTERKSRRKKRTEEAPVESATPAAESTPTPEVTPSIEATPSSEVTPVADTTPQTESTPEVTPSPETEIAAPTPEATIGDLNLDEINKEAAKIDEEKNIATPTPEANATPSLSDLVDDKTGTSGSAGTGEKSEKSEGEAVDVVKDLQENIGKTEPTSKKVEETLAPDYLKSGRGLVYNCKDGHWACVPRDQYLQCKNNHLWNLQSNKPFECFEISVYATEKDCTMAQKHKIDTLAKNDFCK